MERTLTWNVTPDWESATVGQFLRARGCSHHVLVHLKACERGILHNGSPAYTNRRLAAGDTVTVCIRETESSPNIVPVEMPLDIVYEDEDILVLNKDGDTPIHPSINNYENTLANGVMYYYASRGIPFVYRCINRLDRDTSGLLIIAKHLLSAAVLSEMSAERRIHREYLAIVEGRLPESGTIDAPIARQPDSVLMRCVDQERGQCAVTHYRRLDCRTVAVSDFRPTEIDACAAQNNQPTVVVPGTTGHSEKVGCSEKAEVSLAAVTLETGRTHQIRVHMKHIGHPLIGDFLYNPQSQALIERQALHSHRLEFVHPITGEELSFVCGMPEDMRRVVAD